GAWSADEGTIQRYTVVEPEDLFAEKGATVTTRDIAQTRYGSAYSETGYTVAQTGKDPRTRETVTTNNNTRKKTTNGDSSLPAFRVSESGLLAVPDEGQARNLYAGQATVDRANRVFAAAGTQLRLTSEGRGIRVPQDPQEPESPETRWLDKVHAAREIPADDENEARIEIAQTFPVTECDNFVKLVLGASASASRTAVLEKYGEDGETEIPAEARREPLVPIARELTRGKAPTANRVKKALAKRKLPEEEAQRGQIDYEQLDEEEMTARSSKIGINDFALPEVGEGFIIRSMRTQAALAAQAEDEDPPQEAPVHNNETRQEMKEGYLAALAELEQAEASLEQGRSNVSARVQEMMRTWGEHYAGVVAKDGDDVVTLENYNRWQEVQWEHERIFNNLFRDFGAFRDLVANQVESLERTPDTATIQRLVREALNGNNLKKKYRAALQEAKASFLRGLELNARAGTGNFFFQMYGPGEQSFHSAYKGTASNPMTLRIRESEDAVRAQAVHWLGELDTQVTRLNTGITAHPVPGATANVVNRVQAARAEHTRLTQALPQANGRGALKEIEQAAVVEKNTVAMDVRAELSAAYVRITGNQLAQQPGSFRELRQLVDTYVNSYSFFQRVGTRYNSITALQALLVAIGG
ncbi:MAG TPA: hypothetical protein VJ885_18075, partial [Thermoanaerobaculia bacterium]|nr:hypothetical protein [Thermoanaerobaculia bacterium]